ncbi:hypothetical protein [Silvanigrella sp.]|jgi:outer membrane protein assembly factor BamE (lipoprotein component of BamABCDE complex)|uniref:hypothetical protein n=1 Tax=Silvanigrella sp. TaxID=2024976 RepID=UPI0037C53696|nr:hypothetical protein [Silvanigrellaceae bacterium]
MNPIQLAILFCSLIFLCSCTTIGNQFTADFKNISLNSTTREEIETIYGYPLRADFLFGMKTYYYRYAKINLFLDDVKLKELRIHFNDNDTVNSYSYSSNFNKDKKMIYEKPKALTQ